MGTDRRVSDFDEILEAFEKALLLEAELGTRTVPCDRALLVPMKPVAAVKTAPVPPPPAPSPSAPSASVSHVQPSPSASAVQPVPPVSVPPVPSVPSTVSDVGGDVLGAAFRTELEACTKCPLATLGRTHVVTGQGNGTSPDYMFIGEAPGEEEDRQGLAFVGAAGRFLTKMILAMGYTREQVFIANICKCRPPKNRTPTPQEMVACLPYLHRQIAQIKPKCIILLGRTAMSGLFPHRRIRRGVWEEYAGIPVIATFHPAYVLRFESGGDPTGLRQAKLEIWNTLKMALARFGRTPPTVSRK